MAREGTGERRREKAPTGIQRSANMPRIQEPRLRNRKQSRGRQGIEYRSRSSTVQIAGFIAQLGCYAERPDLFSH